MDIEVDVLLGEGFVGRVSLEGVEDGLDVLSLEKALHTVEEVVEQEVVKG